MTDNIFEMVRWARHSNNGYEISSKGDKRFSALFATMPDGRTIEMWYQCDVKGWQPGGTSWTAGKGKPSLVNYPGDGLYEMYLSLWRFWAINHQDELIELDELASKHEDCLTDMFASTPVNQARALAQILNEWIRRS